jgi:CubicO group peptidase (beta-lactamase class C family)
MLSPWKRFAAVIAATTAILLLPSLLAAQQTGLAGHWEGAIELPGMKLGIDLDFKPGADGAWTGDISIPQQKAQDVPLSNLQVNGAEVAFALEGIPGTPAFKGKLEGDRLAGDFSQGGRTVPFAVTRGADPAQAAREALAGYDELVTKMIEDWKVPGVAVAIVKGGDVVYAKGFGYRDMEKKLPVTPDTLFSIGSCSKAFTTFTMATLVEEGKLQWDEPVRTFLPEFKLYDPIASELITPRDLVTHRSGLPRHDLLWYNNNKLSRREMVERLRYLEPNEKLRAKWQYNNLMFLTAGYLIEHVTGKSWEDNVRERIFQPLGMTHSNFSVLDSQKAADFAQPYREEDDKIELIPFRNIVTVGPAGSINSSVHEMSKWIALHLGGGQAAGKPLVSAATLADLHAPHMVLGGPGERPEFSPASYALGWAVDTYRGHQRIQHGGSIDGFQALVSLLPQDGVGMVILVNKQSGITELLERHTMDRLLGLDPIDWNGEALTRRDKTREAAKAGESKKASLRKTGTKPSHKLQDYAGEYEHPGYGIVKVAVQGDRLELTYNDITAPLDHWHYEVWNGAEDAADPTFENSKILFQGDIKGNVASLAAQFEPQVKDIVFTKKPDARLSDPAYLQRYVGEYTLADEKFTIAVSGNALTVTPPGGGLYHLVPGTGGEFVLKEYSVVSLVFREDAQGNVTGMDIIEPDEAYEVKKTK